MSMTIFTLFIAVMIVDPDSGPAVSVAKFDKQFKTEAACEQAAKEAYTNLVEAEFYAPVMLACHKEIPGEDT